MSLSPVLQKFVKNNFKAVNEKVVDQWTNGPGKVWENLGFTERFWHVQEKKTNFHLFIDNFKGFNFGSCPFSRRKTFNKGGQLFKMLESSRKTISRFKFIHCFKVPFFCRETPILRE